MICNDTLRGVPLLLLANKQDLEVGVHVLLFLLFLLNYSHICRVLYIIVCVSEKMSWIFSLEMNF